MQYVAFYGVFFLVLYGMHFFVFWRLNRFLEFSNPRNWFVFFTVVAVSFPLTSLLEKFYPNIVSMICYAVASTLLGVVFVTASFIVAVDILGYIVKAPPKYKGIFVISCSLLICSYGLINAMFIKTRDVKIPMPGIEEGLRIVQLSDIHIGTIHNSGFLSRIVEKTNSLNPDMVLITGDMFDGIGPVREETVAPLKALQAKTFFVMGNHEMYDGFLKTEKVLGETGVIVLRNEVFDYKGVQIIGIDFPDREGEKDNPVIHSIQFDRTKPSILMYHSPTGLQDAAKAGVNLQVSGHTHGGQIFPFSILTGLFYKKIKGLYEVDEMLLYVSQGTGTWGPPMRIGSVNEITLINIVPVQ